MEVFLCPRCNSVLQGFYPETCTCGYSVPLIDSVYQFCSDPPVALDTEGHRYLGYENVGENYDGPSTNNAKINYEYGVSGSCSRRLVELLGRGCVVLDLGAGLGPTSIALAMAGATVVSTDISQRMLSIAANRASNRLFDGRLVFARMNAYNLAICDNCVDAVIAIDVLHQLDNPETAIKEILRVLKPGGVFAEYGVRGLPISEDQKQVNHKCTEALNDLRGYYQKSLVEYGYAGPPFSTLIPHPLSGGVSSFCV